MKHKQMSNRVKLTDLYIDDDVEKFSYYDYIKQLHENGIRSSFIELLNEIKTSELLFLIAEYSRQFKSSFNVALKEEILKRCGEK